METDKENRPLSSRVGREHQRYNPETGSRVVAGCICLDAAKEKVILILSSQHKDRWILPKGGVELDEGDDFTVTAARETWEEAGVEGRITSKLPVVQDSRRAPPVIKPGEDFDPAITIPKSEFHFYEMIVDNLTSDWPEKKERQRRWCTYTEAKHELIKAKRKELVQALQLSSILRYDDNSLDETY